ncbi:phosphoribosylaminoimidazolesuccinocarboxamide synthase [Acidimicrobiia bacterium EGI L10123]|uniref:phosphoribosylaminoimidazolesuccinocarboxamide synthase n=1 Tax=Salinilacustrithrix flava TaxID=2957203 RepID=UPI003D7C2241|nr:phosphoribosylaminoimidazolesuccinocarboxamide synthase [Acidimicrobiia bacterium EGI L10123]
MKVDLPLLNTGKVRAIYDAGPDHLLMVASDRISAFDVVMAETIPDKGRVLTAMSAFWFELLADVAPNHLVSTDLADFPDGAHDPSLAGRTMLTRRAEMLPVECIVRGYLTGSAWKEYQADGTMHGQELPDGLLESDRLPEPVFTPSTKAEMGDHDENIDFARAVEILGEDVAEQARAIALAAYRKGADWARERGIIIADTKFELGWIEGELAICDEVLTPDSSRFWPAADWKPGTTPPSFDKQPVRDWLAAVEGWDKTPPPPALPDEVVEATATRYREAYERICGRSLADWPGGT